MLNWVLLFSSIICISCRQNTALETDFGIPEVTKITTIEISALNRPTQVLKIKGDRWWLNDTIKVRQDAMDNIFRILPGLKVMYHPPKSAWEIMVNAIRNEGVQVKFSEGTNKIIKVIHLGGTTNDERGTYAMLGGSSNPYVIHVPGFEGSLATRFILSELDWRDRMIIDEPKEDIEYLKIQYPAAKEKGFEIQKMGNEFIIRNYKQEELEGMKPLIITYMDGLKGVGCESIENEFVNKSIVLSGIPHAIIEIHTVHSLPRKILFFANNLEPEAPMERMFVFDGKDFYLAQMRILQRLFRPLDYFVTQ